MIYFNKIKNIYKFVIEIIRKIKQTISLLLIDSSQ